VRRDHIAEEGGAAGINAPEGTGTAPPTFATGERAL
jgi:hypothetical protein